MKIVINFGEKKWDAPVTLHEMFDKTKRKFQRNRIIREMIPDYKFILIDPHQMSEDDFERMNTNLGNVLRIINYAGNKDKLIKFAESGAKFNQLETQLINKFTGVDMEVPEENEVKKMSEGFRQIIDESKAEGENKLSALFRALEKAGRKDDAFKAASDAEYRQKLYEEFGIE